MLYYYWLVICFEYMVNDYYGRLILIIWLMTINTYMVNINGYYMVNDG